MATITTDVQVCNRALGLLKLSPITTLGGTDARNVACNLLYAAMRDEVLARLPWHFAVKRATLTLDGATPTNGWDYQFDVPTDCLRMLGYDTENNTLTEPEWTREGAFILSNENTFDAVYIYQNTTISEWSEDFVTCLVYRLAAELALVLSASESLFSGFMGAYERKLVQAGAQGTREQNVNTNRASGGSWSKK